MSLVHLTRIALVGILLGLAACGIKGDPIQPGSEEDQKKQQSGY